MTISSEENEGGVEADEQLKAQTYIRERLHPDHPEYDRLLLFRGGPDGPISCFQIAAANKEMHKVNDLLLAYVPFDKLHQVRQKQDAITGENAVSVEDTVECTRQRLAILMEDGVLPNGIKKLAGKELIAVREQGWIMDELQYRQDLQTFVDHMNNLRYTKADKMSPIIGARQRTWPMDHFADLLYHPNRSNATCPLFSEPRLPRPFKFYKSERGFVDIYKYFLGSVDFLIRGSCDGARRSVRAGMPDYLVSMAALRQAVANDLVAVSRYLEVKHLELGVLIELRVQAPVASYGCA